jgi:hypothetical protein
MAGADGSTIEYMTDADALRPPASVYEHDAVCKPIPSDAYGPEIALSVAANDEFPSSASVTLHVAAGTEPLLYVAPPVTPPTDTCGGVFAGVGAVTFTVNVTGVMLNDPVVVLEVSVALIVAEPAATGVTVTTGPVDDVTQLVKVTLDGFTVATPGSLDESEIVAVVLPVRLQPGLPSPPSGTMYSRVVPLAAPAVSGIVSATASAELSKLLEIPSANAAPAIPNRTPTAADARTAAQRSPRLFVRVRLSTFPYSFSVISRAGHLDLSVKKNRRTRAPRSRRAQRRRRHWLLPPSAVAGCCGARDMPRCQ